MDYPTIKSEVFENLVSVFEIDEVEAEDILHYTGAYLPTRCSVGIEIEVKWRDYFPELWNKYLKDKKYSDLSEEEKKELTEACNLEEVLLLARLNQTIQCGIPKGADKYWEFAFNPVYNLGEIAVLVDALQATELLPWEGSHSLHITIGGMRANRDACYLLMLMESIASSRERIEQGFPSSESGPSQGWSKKGYAGMFEKDSKDLLLDASQAVEFRTLELNNTTDLQSLFKFIQVYADVVIDKQNKVDNMFIPRWDNFVDLVSKKLIELGLPDENMKKPRMNMELWTRYANVFDELMGYVRSISHDVLFK